MTGWVSDRGWACPPCPTRDPCCGRGRQELAYSMAKGAINVLCRTLAHTVGARGITVNAVAPGVTDTDANVWIHSSPEMEALTATASALNRIGQPSDIADIVAFLASDDARWITGDVIDATGGTFLGPRI
ncbi:SDR family oxidoreductase [Nonomuraea sp. NPDC005983]|uniref:SDR family oxidoreductase n=1 Tax=Nonomuraea sp. NPDC005983 TaxID=3155595 RepID=UPI0033A76180